MTEVEELNALRLENLKFRGEIAMLIGYMEMCRGVNAERYVAGLVDRLNDAAAVIGLAGRYTLAWKSGTHAIERTV